jgi:hypothetical protein
MEYFQVSLGYTALRSAILCRLDTATTLICLPPMVTSPWRVGTKSLACYVHKQGIPGQQLSSLAAVVNRRILLVLHQYASRNHNMFAIVNVNSVALAQRSQTRS